MGTASLGFPIQVEPLMHTSALLEESLMLASSEPGNLGQLPGLVEQQLWLEFLAERRHSLPSAVSNSSLEQSGQTDELMQY